MSSCGLADPQSHFSVGLCRDGHSPVDLGLPPDHVHVQAEARGQAQEAAQVTRRAVLLIIAPSASKGGGCPQADGSRSCVVQGSGKSVQQPPVHTGPLCSCGICYRCSSCLTCRCTHYSSAAQYLEGEEEDAVDWLGAREVGRGRVGGEQHAAVEHGSGVVGQHVGRRRHPVLMTITRIMQQQPA